MQDASQTLNPNSLFVDWASSIILVPREQVLRDAVGTTPIRPSYKDKEISNNRSLRANIPKARVIFRSFVKRFLQKLTCITGNRELMLLVGHTTI